MDTLLCMVTCSCGKTTILHLPPFPQKSWTEDEKWQYHQSETGWGSRYWNCGEAVHFQAKVEKS